MIVVTGAAGFIASNLIKKLNQKNYNSIVAVDKFDDIKKNSNWSSLRLKEKIDRGEFINWLNRNHELVEFIFHIGARTDTSEMDSALLDELNTQYSKDIWTCCAKYQIPLVYASSAATYGSGEFGYDDDESIIGKLKPLNPYGQSKQDFDRWVLMQESKPFFWAGLKFFNVYGPNENHKGRMASVVWHSYQQIKKTGKMKLFKSHHSDYDDGKQQRDFIYVDDVVAVCQFLMDTRKNSGIYNLGSGKARYFVDLATAVFQAMNEPVKIEYIDIPIDIRENYQYFTEAKMEKLRGIGYDLPFFTIEEGVGDYVKNYLMIQK